MLGRPGRSHGSPVVRGACMLPRVFAAGLLLLLVGGRAAASEGARFFEAEVLPVLRAHCLTCHGGDKARGGLHLTSREAILKGGDHGPAVSLDKPDESLLLRAVCHQDPRMPPPPRGKLAAAQIDVLARWMKMGVP